MEANKGQTLNEFLYILVVSFGYFGVLFSVILIVIGFCTLFEHNSSSRKHVYVLRGEVGRRV